MSDLTAESLRALLDYDPETGLFHWKSRPARNMAAGSIAGRTDRRGYVGINIRYRKYAAHRLAWLYVHGVWPKSQIDHINRNPGDNRIDNLRDVSGSENCTNRVMPTGRASLARGVSLHKRGRWQAQICIGRTVKYLGLFDTVEEAEAAYAQARAAA